MGNLLVRLSLWTLSIAQCYKNTKIKHEVSETGFVLQTKSKHLVVLHVSYIIKKHKQLYLIRYHSEISRYHSPKINTIQMNKNISHGT